MKRLFIILTVSLFAVSAFSQVVESGKIRYGGATNLGFTNTKFKNADYSTNQFAFSSDVGYFFWDNLSVDVGFDFLFGKDSDEKDWSSIFEVGLGARYYLPVKVFVGADFSAITFTEGDDSEIGYGIKLKAGYAVFLRDNIAFEPSIGYRLGLAGFSDDDKSTKFNKLSAQIGISVFF